MICQHYGADNPDNSQYFMVLLNGDTFNYIALAGLDDTDSEKTFQQIVNSVKFK